MLIILFVRNEPLKNSMTLHESETQRELTGEESGFLRTVRIEAYADHVMTIYEDFE